MRDAVRRQTSTFDVGARAHELMVRAHRLRRRGDHRRAALTMREACGLDHLSAAHWMMYGNYLAHLGRRDDAEHAMKQALYLRERSGEKAKANVIRRELLRVGRASQPRVRVGRTSPR